MGISQALLSHYENGVREPGLPLWCARRIFTASPVITCSAAPCPKKEQPSQWRELGDVSSEKGNVLRGSVVAMLQKKLLVNSAGILLDLLGKAGDRGLINDVSSYLSAALYKMYRYVYLISGKHSDSMFPVPASLFADLCDAEMKLPGIPPAGLGSEKWG